MKLTMNNKVINNSKLTTKNYRRYSTRLKSKMIKSLPSIKKNKTNQINRILLIKTTYEIGDYHSLCSSVCLLPASFISSAPSSCYNIHMSTICYKMVGSIETGHFQFGSKDTTHVDQQTFLSIYII